MKIGIFGGSFNPPHNGHLYLAEKSAKLLSLDKIIIVPSCIPPHKSSASLADKADRLEMCRLAFSDPLYEISTLELDRGDKSYTVDTLREFHRIYPNDKLFFIIGSDMLHTFTQWYKWEEILELCTLCAASRSDSFVPDFSPFTRAQLDKIVFLKFKAYELSSTLLRARIKSGYNCNDLLNPAVTAYIAAHGLYDDNFDAYRKIMCGMLDSRRLYHCECVSESADELAALYGADREKAKLAGLLHDITKQLPAERQIALIGDMTPLELKNYKVWHQMSGPAFLKENGIVTDDEILSAIRWHTTGKAEMTLLEKIIYTADFISADREYDDIETVRRLAHISLEHAILYTSRYTVEDLVKQDRPVHPSTLECYNDMLRHFDL